MEFGVYRRPMGAAMVLSSLLLLLGTGAQPGPPPVVALPLCQHAFSPLNALAERLPHSVARLARNDLREVAQGDAQAPDDAKLSLAVNVRNACGGAIVLPDLTVVTIDPQALGADRLVRVSKMTSNSLIVQLSPLDPRLPTSLPDHTLHHYHLHQDDPPQITVSYPVTGTKLPDHIPHQVYARKYINAPMSFVPPTTLAKAVAPIVALAPPAPIPTATAQQQHAQAPLPRHLPRQTAPPRLRPTPMPVSLRPIPPLPLHTPPAFQSSVSRLVDASMGGHIGLEQGPAVLIGPEALQSNATVTLNYNPVHPVFAETTNYMPTTGTLRITISRLDQGTPPADALIDSAALKNQVIMVIFPHPPHVPPTMNGLTIMRANYLDGQFWNQTESDVRATPQGDVASFSAMILRGHQATFSIEQYVNPLPSF